MVYDVNLLRDVSFKAAEIVCGQQDLIENILKFHQTG